MVVKRLFVLLSLLSLAEVRAQVPIVLMTHNSQESGNALADVLSIDIRLNVSNVGTRDGEEVVQLYTQLPDSQETPIN